VPRPICRHCRKRPVNRPCGLCWGCYYAPGVKELYPSTSKFRAKREPTMAELEALIAEQSRPENLPAWWRAESELVKLPTGIEPAEPAGWARGHAACVGCGRTDRPHRARGRCGPCYQRVRLKGLKGASDGHETAEGA
jgi:hypothetical protein